MSDQTIKPSKKTRLIIGEVGVDTETGIVGKGHSYDNGKTFTVDDTIYGRIYHADDHGKIWEGIQDQVAKVVAPAKSAADNAVKTADAAVASAKVTRASVDAIASAIAEAKAGTNDALSSIQQAIANASSDAAKIRSDVAKVQDEINTAKTANESEIKSIQDDLKKTSASIDTVKGHLESVSSDLDTYAKSAADQGHDITVIKQKQGQFEVDYAGTKGDVNQIRADIKGLSESLKDSGGNIASLQATAEKLQASMSDTQKNVSDLQVTAKKYERTFEDHSGRLSKVEQTASTLTNEFSDEQGHLNRVEQTANGTKQTVSDQQGQINKIKTDADGIHETLTGQGNQIATINVTLSGLSSKYEGVSGDLGKLKDQTNWKIVTGVLDANQYTKTARIFYQDTQAKNTPNVGWFYLIVDAPSTSRITQTLIRDNTTDTWTRVYNGSWQAWTKGATNLDVTALSNSITTNSTQITQNKQTIALKADQSTVDNLSGEVSQNKAQLKVQADQISSKVSSEDFKTLDNKVGGAIAQIDKNDTAIDQTNKDISLKADQTEVDKVKNTASQNSSQIKLMANEIKSKVTSTDVDNIVDSKGYATASTVQSLVTQKADDWNLNLTSLKTDVNAIKMTGGGVNLLMGTAKCEFPLNNNGGTQTVQKYDDETNYIQCTSNTPIDKMGPWWSLTPEVGQVYTLSADVCGNGFINGGGKFHYEGGDNGNLGQVNLTNDWQRISNTFRVNTISGNWVNWVIYANNSTLLKVKHIKIEKGTVTHDWSPAPSDMATVTSVTNLSAAVDGIKSTVANKADQSTVTQLSNVIQSKVSSSDFDNLSKAVELQTLDWADINNMRTNGHYFVHNLANNPIGGWVYVDITGNGNDRIRQDVYQDIGIGHKYRRWVDTYWTGWEEGATKSEINQLSDDINLRVTKGDLISQINLQVGTSLIQSDKLVLDAKTTVFTGDAFIPSAAISNISADKIMLGSSTLYDSNGTLNLVNVKDGITSKITVTQGGVDFDGIDKNASIINFASDNNTNAFKVTPIGAMVTPTLFFERFGQAAGHWLGFSRNKVRNEGLTFHTWDDDGERFFVNCHARFDRNLSATGNIYQGSWDGTTGKPEAGILSIKGGNTIWSGSSFLAIGDNISGTYTNVIAKSFSQQSTLSAKTNIETVDSKDALDLVNRTDIRSYQYKTDVAEGKTKRYTSLIIDDVNDVSKYYTPDEFTNEERTGRDDGSAVGYLFLAVKELTKRIEKIEEKLHG